MAQRGSSEVAKTLLAQEVERALRERDWSLRQAELETGLSAGTIDNMRKGRNVKVDNILRFALAIAEKGREEETVSHWLQIAAQRYAGMASPPDSEEDPLLHAGHDVDITPLAAVPLAPGRVSASPIRIRNLMNAPPAKVGERLPEKVRAIEIEGDCLGPFFEDGDVLFVQESDRARSGDRVLVLIDLTGLTCGVLKADGKPYLEISDGPGRIEADRFRVLGIVVGFYRRMKR